MASRGTVTVCLAVLVVMISKTKCCELGVDDTDIGGNREGMGTGNTTSHWERVS